MGLFDRGKDIGVKGTTKDYFLGNPEAEGEGLHNDFSFADFFEDFMGITKQISNGKFLILGRKGVGKSAYAKYIVDTAATTVESYACLLKNSDINFEGIVQRLPDEVEDKNTVLFEWIILTRMVELIISSHRAQFSENLGRLREFYEKNTGLIQVDQLAMVDFSSEKERGLNIDSIRGLLSGKFGSKSTANYVKPPFYHFITPLRNIVCETLQYEDLSDLDFIVMFDDLDVKFNLKIEANHVKLMDLLRVARDYNTKYFHSTNAKVLVFLRDDIARQLKGVSSDKTKILGSYTYKIDWYNHQEAAIDQKSILLRKFINKRIAANFQKFGHKHDSVDPWSDFVDDRDPMYGKKGGFKFLLDCTFYRPRDLLNLFKTVGEHEYKLPLSEKVIKALLKSYGKDNFEEVSDELSVIFDRQQLGQVESLLNEVAKKDMSYSKLCERTRAHKLQKNDIVTLIEYSLLVPIDDNGHHYFSYREDVRLDNIEKYSFTTPHCITLYFNPDKVLGQRTKRNR